MCDIKVALNHTPSNNRSQLQRTDKNTLILDMYNANPTSMRAALEQFVTVSKQNTAVILGEMYELGDISIAEHSAILDFIKKSAIEKIFLVGNWPQIQQDNIYYFANSQDVFEYLQTHALQGYTILIKGSRGVKLNGFASVIM